MMLVKPTHLGMVDGDVLGDGCGVTIFNVTIDAINSLYKPFPNGCFAIILSTLVQFDHLLID